MLYLYNNVNKDWNINIGKIIVNQEISNLDFHFYDVKMTSKTQKQNGKQTKIEIDHSESRYYVEDWVNIKLFPRYIRTDHLKMQFVQASKQKTKSIFLASHLYSG